MKKCFVIMLLKNWGMSIFSTLLIFFYIACPQLSFSGEKNCLKFTAGKSINMVDAYISRFHLSSSQGNTNFYSATYDLDGDGAVEYFYYSETTWFCGMQTGCQILVYKYSKGKFKQLFEYGISTNNLPSNIFDPEKPDHKNFICIEPEKDLGWHRVSIKGTRTWTYYYNGKNYDLLK